jgi:hypothetical protein
MAANDVSNLKIDQAKSFAGMVFLSCQPKNKFGSDQQEVTKDGRLKWTIEVLAAVHNAFLGGTENKVFTVGISSRSNPGEGIPSFAPVELSDFEIGVSEKTRKTEGGGKELTGFSVWFRCTEITLVGQSAVAKAA